MTATTSFTDRLTRPTERRLGFCPALDGVRGLGVVLVMSFHFVGSKYLVGAPILVDLFFALSGFLITTLLFEERAAHGAISLRKFYARRIFRLFPALYALLGVFLVWLVLFGGEHRSEFFAEFVTAGLYVYNLLVAYTGVEGKALVQLWTLSIEEQFYFVWPIVLLTVLRARRHIPWRLLFTFIGVVVVTLPILRMTLDPVLGARTFTSTVFGLSIMRPDSILLGCVAAVAWRLEPTEMSARTRTAVLVASRASLALFCATLMLGGFSPFAPFVSPLYNLTVLTTPLWVLDLVRDRDSGLSRFLSHPVLLWLGKRSYGLYIWHMLVYIPIQSLFNDLMAGRTRLATIAAFPFAFAATIGIAVLSWNYVEAPALRVKQRFSRSDA